MSRNQPHSNTLCSVGPRSAGFVMLSAEVDPIPALYVKATGGRFRRSRTRSGDARIMQSHGSRATAQDYSTFMIFLGLSTRLRRTIRCGGVFGGTEEYGCDVRISSATPRMPHYPGRVRGMSIRVNLRHKFFHDFPAPFPKLDCPATNQRHTLRVIQSFSEMQSLPSPNACVHGLYVHYFERIIEQMRRFKSIDLAAHELPIRYIFRSETDVTDFYAEEYFLDCVTYIDDDSFAIEVTGMTDNPDNYTPETIEAARIERAPGTEKRFVVNRETVAEPPYIYLLGFYELMRLLERTAELCDGGCLAADMQPIYDDDSQYAELMSDLDRIGHEIMEEKRFPNPVISNPPS